MSSENCFLETHFYSGGLRHQFYCLSKSRPSWAPSPDSVGFSDEFELREGDAAIEMRRFAMDGGNVTWIGVYYKSVDARMGDRGNHAGVGVWLQNKITADSHAILHGLSLLAQRVSQEVDPASIEADAIKFLSTSFLPAYILDESEIAPSTGFPFAPTGIVDSKLYFLPSATSVSESRALGDFISNALILEKSALPPRLLIKVGKAASEDRNRLEAISTDYEVTSKLLHAVPRFIEAERMRADRAEAEAAEVKKSLRMIEADYSGLKAESADLARFRDDPQRVVNERLADIQSDIRNLSSKIDTVSHRPTVTPTWSPAGVRRRTPVGSVSNEEPVESSGDYWWWVAGGVGLILLVVLLFILVDRLVYAL